MLCKNLDDYLTKYGPLLAKQAEATLRPLHNPARDDAGLPKLLRTPFPAQAHVARALVKAWARQKASLLVAEMGTGKTFMACAAIHARASGTPYRALVFCPGQLVNKWKREVEQTIPGARVQILESWRDLLPLNRATKPAGPEWYVIGRDRAKLGSTWRPAFTRGRKNLLTCPSCGCILMDKDGAVLFEPDLKKKRLACLDCGSPLWQMTRQINRYEPALYVKRRLKGFFKYLVIDEAHEEKGADTAQANAAGALAAACPKALALTGTLIGGYAEHLRPLLLRLGGSSLIREGFGWSNAQGFSEAYGRVETRVTEREGGDGADNRMSRGKARSVTKSVRPGVMPALFGRHLIDKAVFLGLAEVADRLPKLVERCLAVPMDEETAPVYKKIEKDLRDTLKEMVRKGDRRLLGAMLQTLLAYPDHPFGWDPVGYWEKGGGDGAFVTVTIPENLDDDTIRPKEQALIELCRKEKAEGRKVWVYVQFTDKHDVQGRLEKLLAKAGLKVKALRSSVTLAKREEWIAKNAPGADVVISHPRLVETGLDLFDKAGKYNFPTLVFYETGYNLFTLRQAARRSWRIGQKAECRVFYFYYMDTMQERAMSLMGKKLVAAQALEGKFSEEGLLALADGDDGVEVALAKSLADRIREGSARRVWGKVGGRKHLGEGKRSQGPSARSPAAGPR